MSNSTSSEILKVDMQSQKNGAYKTHVIDLACKYLILNDSSLIDKRDNKLYFDYERLLTKRDISFFIDSSTNTTFNKPMIIVKFNLIVNDNRQITDIEISVENDRHKYCEYSYANSKLVETGDELSLLIYFCRDTYMGYNRPVNNIYCYNSTFYLNREIITSG